MCSRIPFQRESGRLFDHLLDQLEKLYRKILQKDHRELFLTCVILDDQLHDHALVVFLALQTLLMVVQSSDSQMMIQSRWFGHASLDLSVLSLELPMSFFCFLTCGYCRTTSLTLPFYLEQMRKLAGSHNLPSHLSLQFTQETNFPKVPKVAVLNWLLNSIH